MEELRRKHELGVRWTVSERHHDRKVKTYMRMREEEREEEKKELGKTKDLRKMYYDKGKKERKFRTGDWVLIENF